MHYRRFFILSLLAIILASPTSARMAARDPETLGSQLGILSDTPQKPPPGWRRTTLPDRTLGLAASDPAANLAVPFTSPPAEAGLNCCQPVIRSLNSWKSMWVHVDSGIEMCVLARGSGSPCRLVPPHHHFQRQGGDEQQQAQERQQAIEARFYDFDRAPDPTQSAVSASPATATADGSSSATITVQLRNREGGSVGIGGAPVTVATTLGSLSPVTDQGNGSHTATLTSATLGTAVVSAQLGGTPIPSTASVTFVPGPAARLAIVPVTDLVANRQSSSTATVRVEDATGHLVSDSTPLSRCGSAAPLRPVSPSPTARLTSPPPGRRGWPTADWPPWPCGEAQAPVTRPSQPPQPV